VNDPIIDALRAEQSRLATESLKRSRITQGDVAFEYGYAVGLHAGFERSIERILALYRDDRGDLFE
jgi:hypothetical protein